MIRVNVEGQVLPVEPQMSQGRVVHGWRGGMADGVPKDRAIAGARVDRGKLVRHGPVIGSNEPTAKNNFALVDLRMFAKGTFQGQRTAAAARWGTSRPALLRIGMRESGLPGTYLAKYPLHLPGMNFDRTVGPNDELG